MTSSSTKGDEVQGGGASGKPDRATAVEPVPVSPLRDGIPSAVAPTCIECGRQAQMVGGRRIYPHRADLFDRFFFLCECGAYCGTHRDTKAPLGYPCGPATRKARSRAHAAFDPLWRGKHAPMRRGEAYMWLARRLGISNQDCHIGMMDAQMADATARFATERAQAIETRRAETERLGAQHESAVPQGCAQTPSESPHHDK